MRDPRSIFVSQPLSNPETPSPSARLNRFRLFAVILGLLPFILIELALRIIGVQPARHDPFAEFGGGVPTFIRDGNLHRTNPAREPFIAPQSFAVSKSSNTKRILCFGGSTVHGRPFQPATAFPAWLKIELEQCAPDHHWEVINCGGISYASYRIVPMVREAMAYEPDLILVATGHNEFLEDRTYTAAKQRPPLLRQLETLRTVRLAREWLTPAPATNNAILKTRLDKTSGYASYHRDPEWHTRVQDQYRDALMEIAHTCAAADVPLMFIELGSNLRDCPPFKSEHRSKLSPSKEQEWQATFDEASRLESDQPKAALDAYRRALAIDDQFALLHFRIARLLDRMNAPEAELHYVLARDHDICPLRMLTGQADALRLIATQHEVPLIPVQFPKRLPGFDWYLDHVHPSISGHQLIAQTIAADPAFQKHFIQLSEWTEEDRRTAYVRHFANLPPRYLGDGQRRLSWLDNWARREKLLNEAKPISAQDHLRHGIRHLDFGDFDNAQESFKTALQLKPKAATTRLFRHAAELESQGREQSATHLKQWLQNALTQPDAR